MKLKNLFSETYLTSKKKKKGKLKRRKAFNMFHRVFINKRKLTDTSCFKNTESTEWKTAKKPNQIL